jgi:hypothetical protein
MLHFIDHAINTVLLIFLIAAVPYAFVDLTRTKTSRSRKTQQPTPAQPETTEAMPQTTSDQPKNKLRPTVGETEAAEFAKIDPLA